MTFVAYKYRKWKDQTVNDKVNLLLRPAVIRSFISNGFSYPFSKSRFLLLLLPVILCWFVVLCSIFHIFLPSSLFSSTSSSFYSFLLRFILHYYFYCAPTSVFFLLFNCSSFHSFAPSPISRPNFFFLLLFSSSLSFYCSFYSSSYCPMWLLPPFITEVSYIVIQRHRRKLWINTTTRIAPSRAVFLILCGAADTIQKLSHTPWLNRI